MIEKKLFVNIFFLGLNRLRLLKGVEKLSQSLFLSLSILKIFGFWQYNRIYRIYSIFITCYILFIIVNLELAIYIDSVTIADIIYGSLDTFYIFSVVLKMVLFRVDKVKKVFKMLDHEIFTKNVKNKKLFIKKMFIRVSSNYLLIMFFIFLGGSMASTTLKTPMMFLMSLMAISSTTFVYHFAIYTERIGKFLK